MLTAAGLSTADLAESPAEFLAAEIDGAVVMAERLPGGNAALALLANVLATGAGLFALIQMLGGMSGAHFNPAVTLAMVMDRRLFCCPGKQPATWPPSSWAPCWAWPPRMRCSALHRSPRRIMFGQEEERDTAIRLTPPRMVRQAFTMNRARIVEDLIVLLRRRWTRG